MTTSCGHWRPGKLHDWMHEVIIIEDTPVGRFRDDADHNYEDYIMNSGEFTMSMTRRDECLKRFPTVSDCLKPSGPVTTDWADIEEATGLGLVRGILCAAENAVSEALEKSGLYPVEQLSSTQYEAEEIDHNGVIRGIVLMEYTDGQRFRINIELPMDDYNDDEKLHTFIQHILPGEKEFIIEQYELHVTSYKVKAFSRAEAIATVIKGAPMGTVCGTQFVQVLHEQGMSRDGFEPREIREIEMKVGSQFLPGQIDSIRSVRKV